MRLLIHLKGTGFSLLKFWTNIFLLTLSMHTSPNSQATLHKDKCVSITMILSAQHFDPQINAKVLLCIPVLPAYVRHCHSLLGSTCPQGCSNLFHPRVRTVSTSTVYIYGLWKENS